MALHLVCGVAKPLISTYPAAISANETPPSRHVAAARMAMSRDDNNQGVGSGGITLANNTSIIRICNGSFTGGPEGGVFRFSGQFSEAKGRAVRVPFAAGTASMNHSAVAS